MSDANKTSLEQRLAKLLCLNTNDDREYVTSVLDSLIDMGDAAEDVAEYLSSFIAAGDGIGGGDDLALQQFARDVNRLKMGEDIAFTDSSVRNNEKSTAAATKAKPNAHRDPLANQRKEIKRREMEARQKQSDEQARLKQRTDEAEQERMRGEATAKKMRFKSRSVKKESSSITGSGNPSASVNVKTVTSVGTNATQPPGRVATEKKVPTCHPVKIQQDKSGTWGKPVRQCCGCYGNKHRPLTNCLRCGRISCVVEGLGDFCHCCGYFIDDYPAQMTTGSDKNNSALMHKERLLEFDKTSAARTHIHDDQEDYFVTSSSMWATEQEQEHAGELEENRRKKLHDRQKQVLNLNF